MEEAAAARKEDAAAFYADIEKFYENVSHEVLLREAVAVGFPLRLLKPLLALYSGPWAVVVNGAAGAILQAVGTILAGCSCATVLAKVLLHRLLARGTALYSSVQAKNVVDDVSLAAQGSACQVAALLGSASLVLLQGLADLRLPLSHRKTVYTATSVRVALRLASRWRLAGFHFKRVRAMRNLGVDNGVAQLAGRGGRRGRPVAMRSAGRTRSELRVVCSSLVPRPRNARRR